MGVKDGNKDYKGESPEAGDVFIFSGTHVKYREDGYPVLTDRVLPNENLVSNNEDQYDNDVRN